MHSTRSSNFLGWVLVVALGGVSLACGGSNPGAESAGNAEDDWETVEPKAPPSASGENNSSAGEEGMQSQPSRSVTGTEFQAALQVVLDDDALTGAMELGEPGRFPLKISGPSIPTNLMVTCVGEAAQVVEIPEDPKANPVLVFSEVEFRGNLGTFKYRHDAAGIRGTTKVKEDDGRWELFSSRVNNFGDSRGD